MSNGVFNYAKGAVVEKFRDANAKGYIVLLQANEAEATLIDHPTLASILGNGANVIADFSNYAPKNLLSVTAIVPDTGNDRVDVDMGDVTWVAAGGATNNTLTKLIVCYEESTSDGGRIPLTHHDFAVTTDGSDLTAQFNAVGFFRAT